MIEQPTKTTFVVIETPQSPGDRGDNYWHVFDLFVKVKAQTKEARHIDSLHVSRINLPSGHPYGSPEKHPLMSKCLEISEGDVLLAESPYEKIVGYADWRNCAKQVGTV
jgi:hypothetical protein